jgi:uncharacterized protein (DUF342 family)
LAEATIKIAYAAAQARVRGEFALSECIKAPDSPTQFWPRIKAKLDSELGAGRIGEYAVYQAAFEEAWRACVAAAQKGEAADTTISVVLAQGWPKIPGIEIFKSEAAGVAFELVVKTPPGVARKIPFESFEACVASMAQAAGLSAAVHTAQLRAIWYRVGQSGNPDRETLLAKPKLNTEKGFQMIANNARGEVAAIINDAKLIRTPKAHEQILKLCADSVEKLKQSSKKDFLFLKSEIVSQLNAAMNGPERFGINLPLVLLVANVERTMVVEDAAPKAKSGTTASKNLIKENYPGKGKLPIDVSPDRMEASIGKWPMELYDDKSFQVTVDWIAKEIKNFGITYGFSEHVMKLKEAVSKRKDLTDRCLARGLVGSSGTDPYLHAVFREQAKTTNGESTADIRNSQQREIVQVNQLVAEIRFETGGENGKDIYGKDVSPPVNNDIPVEVGDGVRRDGSRFIATKEGSPIIDGMKISVSDKLVLEEDVNLRTGNVYFKGSAEINGSIDDGSTVEVAGDLIVHGTIRGAFVRVGGKLIVEQGINTAGRGMVRCRSDIEAEFIENSRVACGGNLIVNRVILNSNVVAGGAIVVDPEGGGVVGGGVVSARLMIRTGKLGLPKGNKTEVNVGVDWRAELSMQIRQERLKKISDRIEVLRLELREVIRKKKLQKNPKLEEQAEQMTEFLQRGRTVVEKLEASIAIAKSRIVYDSEARIQVHDVLSSNCNITCGGQKVPVAKDVAGVEINAKRRSGSFIQALEEPEEKKAS